MKMACRFKQNTLLFFTGCFFWLLFVFPFISSGTLYFDAREYSSYINYFLNATASWVYPSWDPYNLFGRPDGLFGRISGDNNPFLFIILILQKIGLPYPKAYVLFYAGYFLFGMAGFFTLARAFLRDQAAAAVSFYILLFSSFGFSVFNDAQIIMIYVPAVWFIYFFRLFWRRPAPRSLLCTVFFLDILLMQYLPFFILTILIVSVSGFCLFYPRSFIAGSRRVFWFFRSKPLLLAVAFCLFLLGIMPILMMWQTIQKGELMLSWRSSTAVGKNLVEIGLAEINNAGFIPYYFSPHYWFSCLKSSGFTHFYAPVMFFCIIPAGFFCLISRRLILLACIFMVLFLISLGSSSGLEPFLYAHVFYFKLFRNLHFLLWLAFPVAVLAAGELLRLIIKWIRDPQLRMMKAAVILTSHAGFIVFLYLTQVHLVWPVYAGVVISGLGFMAFLLFPSWRTRAVLLLLCGILIESGSVFMFYGKNEEDYIKNYQPPPWQKEYRPVFSYQRPLRGSGWAMRDVEGYGSMQDSSGFDYPRFTGSKYVGQLLKDYPAAEIERYVVNKFIVYQQAFSADGIEDRSKGLERIFSGNCAGALIEDSDPALIRGAQKGCAGTSSVLSAKDKDFKVLSFGLDHIRFQTSWPQEKYLVYNDTFSELWQASLNSRPIKIDRANIAFKGLHLPAGTNIVEMTYGSRFNNFLRAGLTWCYVVFALFICVSSFRYRKRMS